jgi:nucleotide-binding universal stress UspA family protein
MFKHILLATDGSTASDHAATLAIDLVRTHGAKLMVVHVVDPYPYLSMGESNPYGFQAYMGAAQKLASEAHAKVNALCMQCQPPIEMQARLIEEVSPAVGIVQTAKTEGADLIVLGSHGRSGIARLMLGSVANKVVAESAVPVLVVR